MDRTTFRLMSTGKELLEVFVLVDVGWLEIIHVNAVEIDERFDHLGGCWLGHCALDCIPQSESPAGNFLSISCLLYRPSHEDNGGTILLCRLYDGWVN